VSGALLIILAIATGSIVANLYYLQPLLDQITKTFTVGAAAAGFLVTLTQVGYGFGLAFVVPLGDLIPRRRLVVSVFFASAIVMAAGGLMRSYAPFAIVAVLIGITSVAGQILIPFSADLAAPHRRARTVAILMSGMLSGILFSRAVSGIVAQLAGWRSVYFGAAALLVIEGLALIVLLPAEQPRPHRRLADTLLGSIRLVRTLPQLRRRGLSGGLAMATFSVLWTTIAFHLAAAPFHMSKAGIGSLGLLGVAGIVAANGAGKLSDKHHQWASSLGAATLMLAGYVMLFLAGSSILVVALGMFVLDAGIWANQVTNQSIIFELAPQERSQMTSAYMVMHFGSGAIGSGLAGWIYEKQGWTGACWLGVSLGIASVIVALVFPPRLPDGALEPRPPHRPASNLEKR
jgi:predicted MFS family arabinose efflux permease